MNERTWRVVPSDPVAVAASVPSAAPTPAAASDRDKAGDNRRIPVGDKAVGDEAADVVSAATGADRRAPGRHGS